MPQSAVDYLLLPLDLHPPPALYLVIFSLVSIHVLAGRTTSCHASRCMDTNDHKLSQLSQKSLQARNKVAHVELLWGLALPVPWYAVTVIYRNQQRKKQKRAKLKTKILTTALGKSLFLIKYRIRCAIYMPPNTKDLAINQTMVTYGNWQNATVFARANNSDWLRSLKHLMETGLCQQW